MRWLVALLIGPLPCVALWAADEDAAKDATIVEALLRVKTVDVNANERLRAAVSRHLERHKGTAEYVDLVEKLKIRGVERELAELALDQPDSTQGVQAATLLMARGEEKLLTDAIHSKDESLAIKAVTALGYVANQDSVKLLQPLLTDLGQSRQLRTAAASALGRNRLGQRFMMNVVERNELPEDLNFAVANILYSSTDAEIRAKVKDYLKLPETAGAKPLPPIAELAKRTGNVAQGHEVFRTRGTCGKCHKVRGEGKEVGPDLSEIGGKLSREAMLMSILDPSAGISHNYESYVAILASGNIVTGLKISETDDEVTLRNAEAIDKTFAKDDIEELVKSPVSLMPADLQKTMSEQDLVDVVEYLTTLKKES